MTTNNYEKILARLRAAKKKNLALAEVVDLQHDLLEAQMQLQPPPPHPHLSAEEAKTRFGSGIPLLRFQEMALEWEAFSNLYKHICRITTQHRPDLSARLKGILALLDDDPDQVRNLMMTYMEKGSLGVREEEKDELFAFVFNHALRPFLLAYADALAPLVEQKFWQRGKCPICGGEPDFAFLDEESGARHLVCSRCDSQWLYARIRCPFCNTKEPDKLSYYPNEDEKYRVYVCQGCQRYLKTIDLRKAGGRVFFPVERVATAALDVAAREEGYQ